MVEKTAIERKALSVRRLLADGDRAAAGEVIRRHMARHGVESARRLLAAVRDAEISGAAQTGKSIAMPRPSDTRRVLLALGLSDFFPGPHRLDWIPAPLKRASVRRAVGRFHCMARPDAFCRRAVRRKTYHEPGRDWMVTPFNRVLPQMRPAGAVPVIRRYRRPCRKAMQGKGRLSRIGHGKKRKTGWARTVVFRSCPQFWKRVFGAGAFGSPAQFLRGVPPVMRRRLRLSASMKEALKLHPSSVHTALFDLKVRRVPQVLFPASARRQQLAVLFLLSFFRTEAMARRRTGASAPASASDTAVEALRRAEAATAETGAAGGEAGRGTLAAAVAFAALLGVPAAVAAATQAETEEAGVVPAADEAESALAGRAAAEKERQRSAEIDAAAAEAARKRALVEKEAARSRAAAAGAKSRSAAAEAARKAAAAEAARTAVRSAAASAAQAEGEAEAARGNLADLKQQLRSRRAARAGDQELAELTSRLEAAETEAAAAESRASNAKAAAAAAESRAAFSQAEAGAAARAAGKEADLAAAADRQARVTRVRLDLAAEAGRAADKAASASKAAAAAGSAAVSAAVDARTTRAAANALLSDANAKRQKAAGAASLAAERGKAAAGAKTAAVDSAKRAETLAQKHRTSAARAKSAIKDAEEAKKSAEAARRSSAEAADAARRAKAEAAKATAAQRPRALQHAADLEKQAAGLQDTAAESQQQAAAKQKAAAGFLAAAEAAAAAARAARRQAASDQNAAAKRRQEAETAADDANEARGKAAEAEAAAADAMKKADADAQKAETAARRARQSAAEADDAAAAAADAKEAAAAPALLSAQMPESGGPEAEPPAPIAALKAAAPAPSEVPPGAGPQAPAAPTAGAPEAPAAPKPEPPGPPPAAPGVPPEVGPQAPAGGPPGAPPAPAAAPAEEPPAGAPAPEEKEAEEAPPEEEAAAPEIAPLSLPLEEDAPAVDKISLFIQLAYLNFISKFVFLPTNWALPVPGLQFDDAFAAADLWVAPNSPLNLFREPTFNAYHVKTAKVIGKGFEKFIKDICDSVCDAIGMWRTLTVFTGVVINGPTGTIVPGGVTGPPLLPFILMSAPMDTPMQMKYSMAIGNAISTAWQTWQSGLTGTLAYPAFAAFPGPMAPPMPSIPIPVAALSSPGESQFSPSTLKSAMDANFGDPTAKHASALFESIARAFFAVFQMFKPATLVLTVLGTGPIPSFAPPVVPVGPVVGGSSIPVPGVIQTIPLGQIPGPTGEYQIELTPFAK